jgi:hypothetical protein
MSINHITWGGEVSPDFLSAGLTITSFKIDGEVYNENAKNWGTVGTVKLKKHWHLIAKLL